MAYKTYQRTDSLNNQIEFVRRKGANYDTVSSNEVNSLIKEFEAYKAKLERQNQELLIANKKLEESKNYLLKEKDEWVEIFDNAPVGYLIVDNKAIIQQSNKTIQNLLGIFPSHFRNQNLANFIHADDVTLILARFAAFFKTPTEKRLALRFIKFDGSSVELELTGRLIKQRLSRKNDVMVENLLISLIDAHEKKELEDELKLATKVFGNSKEAILILDAEINVLNVNQAFNSITGFMLEDVIGKSPYFFNSEEHEPVFFDELWHSLKLEGYWHGDLWGKRKNGQRIAQSMQITQIKNNFGKVTNYICAFSDVTKAKLNEKKIEYLAHHDDLTGLPNRVLLNDRIKHSLLKSIRTNKYLAVLFLDLDRFKILNDTLGHHEGDILLQEVARRLQTCVRQYDTVARFGGDEFVVLLTDFEAKENAEKQSKRIATQILKLLSKPFELSQGEFLTTASVGIALFPHGGKTVDALIKNADTAMYFAKEHGRNNYQFYTETMHFSALERGSLENDLHLALEKNQLSIFFQPQIDLNTEETVSLEALLRWYHPKKGLLSPDHFISIAEDSGLIDSIGEWVLRKSCQQLKKWINQGNTNLKVAVNLSAKQFLKGDLVEKVQRILLENDLAANHLELEITESALMKNMASVTNALKDLLQMGVTISLDDFGTGFSSLTYIKQFPISSIKIDRSFVKNVLTDSDDQAIIKSIISMAHHMNLSIIAEGIENQGQQEWLTDFGCQYGQGYLYAKPCHAKNVTL